MAELRYNPLMKDWVMVASNRQKRPAMDPGQCPFCPGSGRVPDAYDVLAYDNDFPVLSLNPTEPPLAPQISGCAPAYGKCEVILYSSEHQASLPMLSVAHIERLLDLWISRTAALQQDSRIHYIFLFENRGAEVGATMPHPHGQLYAYSYVPSVLQQELDASYEYYEREGTCLLCDLNSQEEVQRDRLLVSNDRFLSYTPYFTEYPFGAFITPRRHVSSLLDFRDDDLRDLAWMLKAVTAGLDRVYEKSMPYMMAVHQAPVNIPFREESYHFHIEFYPLLYAPTKIKYRASSEIGAGAACNPTRVEETAPILRQAIETARRDGGW